MERKRFFCIDAHTCGNPVRVVAGGGPALEGADMGEKRRFFMDHYDWIRRSLMFEPRGHDMMSGSILYPPTDPQNDAAVLFIETSGCLPMCGHGTIGTVTIAIEEGLIIPKVHGQLRLETPAGLVLISYQQEGQKVKKVKLTNVPSFLYASNLEVHHSVLGSLKVDVAYGGNFYAIVEAQENYTDVAQYTADALIAMSRELRMLVNEKYTFVHPLDAKINTCSHVLWTGLPVNPGSHGRNAVFYGDKAIDRSPCGTGTSARMAQLYTKGKLFQGEEFVHESFILSTFTGRIEGITKVGNFDAIIPSIEGWARIFGYNTILVDPQDDPYAGGFQVI
ncbi:MAG TPA: 4-hydroxyproline epimerase [Saprospiraceae bacterium]|nr:4-hydroxyproline epimerase [Saprospiraceae bacterium]